MTKQRPPSRRYLMVQRNCAERWFLATLCALAAFLFVVAVPAISHAEDESPLRLTLLNAAAKGGSSAHDSISELLKKSGDIEAVGQDDVFELAEKEFELSAKDFRSSRLRAEQKENFIKLMMEKDLEALLILDVFSKGKKLQLVAIAPNGEEISDVRRDIRRGKIGKSDAKEILRDTFRNLVPAVRKFREDGGWDAVRKAAEKEDEEEEDVSLMPEKDDEEEAEEGDDEEMSLKDKALAKAKGKYPALQKGVRLQLGLLLGKRGLDMTADTGFELTHASPFAGFGGRMLFIFSNMGPDSALGVAVLGGYAPFFTIFADSNEFASAYARLGGEFHYLKAFSQQLLIDVFGGAEAMSITIESNPFYTGHRYMMARAGAFILYQVGPVLLEAGGAVLPVFSTDNSAGAFGDAGFSLGFEPAAGLSFGITEQISASLRYSLQFFQPEFPEPVILNAKVTSVDMIHTGLVAIGYGL